EKYGPEKVFRGGLRIQTTIDPAVQELAEKTVADSLSGTKPPLDMAMAAVEPPTGYVRALVGGRDFNQSQVNLALGRCPPPTGERPPADQPICIEGGGTGRQPGSAFKVFTLAKALEEGITPQR